MTLTGTRVPAITACPCMTCGLVEIMSSCSDVIIPVCPVRSSGANHLHLVSVPWARRSQDHSSAPSGRGAKLGANTRSCQASLDVV
jgi:hypothetical protein